MLENADKLSRLDILKFQEIILKVLKNKEYDNLESLSTKEIIGYSSTGLGPVKTTFYLNQNVLSGTDSQSDDLIIKLKESYDLTKPNAMVLLSGQTVSNSVKTKLTSAFGSNLQIFERDEVNDLILSSYPNFWMYENFDLVKYEKYFLEEMTEKSALLNIQGLENKAQKVIEIYVKPRIYEIKGDLESNKAQLNRVIEDEIVKRNKPCIIEGETGSGKSTLLKEIGRLQIKEQEELKTLPIFISPISLIECDFDIKTVSHRLLKDKVSGSWQEILNSYKILFLLDNLDEFNEFEQKKVIDQLNDLCSENNVRYIISTRSIKSGKLESYCTEVDLFQIRKFNDIQIREFASRFFNSETIANDLLNALEDYRILQRLPLTPLSLSLIALVYEKENYEIPATISDIYDNFNQLILGKLTATKKFELINFNFRERILSVYALEIVENNSGRPFKKSDFIEYFIQYFRDKASRIQDSVIEEFLEYFISNSGILKIEEMEYVNFSHKSFLEYYASLEIFKHKRGKEELLVQNFLDLNWQNIAIFFAGQSKDMPDFLVRITDKIRRANLLDEHNNAILGLGYLLQALYQTDNKLRKDAVLLALDQNLILHEWYKKKISDGDILLFRNMRLPALSAFNMYFFYLNFLSSTLSEPLDMAFNVLFKKYVETNDSTIGYQLLTIAAIFHSKRIGDSSFLQRLLDETSILKDPYLTTLADFSLYFNATDHHREMKQQVHNAFSKMSAVSKELINTPANRLRFTNLDFINSHKKVVLITEGPTDAEILEHAFFILTNGKIPYWKVKPAGIKGGGAKEVKFTLDKAAPLTEDTDMYIGIFDHDTEGLNQFDGFKHPYYADYQRVKKVDDYNIYAIKLPVPNFRKKYVEQEREHQYLAIEHYFEDEILISHNLIKPSGVPDLLKIKDVSGAKTKFSKYISSQTNPKIFKHFISLFETIDDISGIEHLDYFENI